MKWWLLLGLAACGGSTQPAVDGAPSDTAADAAPDSAQELFGTVSGMCGVLGDNELTGASPAIIRSALSFDRAYVDPADRPLLTDGGQTIAATPNAGGSSGLSEVFAFEQLARCEQATLLKTETQISYDTPGKITDMLVEIDGHKIGVSVTRAVTFPFGEPYTLEAATAILERKLGDIQQSSANVSAADRWEKQVLAMIAWDDQAADTVVQALAGIDAAVTADTIVVVTATGGEDIFLYSNN